MAMRCFSMVASSSQFISATTSRQCSSRSETAVVAGAAVVVDATAVVGTVVADGRQRDGGRLVPWDAHDQSPLIGVQRPHDGGLDPAGAAADRDLHDDRQS